MLKRLQFKNILYVVPLCLLPVSVLAADFTFHVPVEISDIPQQDAIEGRVLCAVDVNGLVTGQALFSLNGDGDFADTLTVLVNANSGVDPINATTWECVVQFRVPGSGNDYNDNVSLVSAIPARRAAGNFSSDARP